MTERHLGYVQTELDAYYIEWLGCVRTDYAGRAVRNFTAAYDLTQLMDGLTRIRDIEWHAPGFMDLLLTYHPDGTRVSRHVHLGTSVHLLICSEVSVIQTGRPRPPETRRV